MSAGAPVPATREEALRALGTADAEMRRLVVRALERAAPDTARELLPLALGDEDWRVRKEAVHLAQSLAERTEVVPVLIGVLAGPSEHVALRNAAVEALSTLGALAAPPIEQLLSTGGLDADGRKLAIDVLAGARQPRSTRVLVACLDDPDPNVRAAAAEALGLVGGERAIDALVSLLSREDRFLRLVALEGLNRLGGNVPTAQLVALSADKILRHAAITALGRTIDPEALPTLVAALDDPSRHVGESALRAIGELLSDEPSLALVARGGTRGIGALGRKRVLDAVHSEDPSLRRAALPVLALLAESAGGDETEALLRALCDPDIAADAEAAVASMGEAILPSLVELARSGEAGSRAAALAVLPRVASDRADAIEVLREALRDRDREIVAAAASAFASALSHGVLPNAADVHTLLRIAAGRDAARGTAAAKAAAIALQSLRTLARVRPDAVRPHLSHVDVADEEAPVVCALLAVAGAPEHVPWLSRAATAPSARTRRAAVEALGQIGGQSAGSALGFAVTDESPEVALAAIKALGKLRDETQAGIGAPALLRLIEATGDEGMLAAALRALGQTHDERAAAPLRPLCRDERPAVACAALEALADLHAPDLRVLARAALEHPSTVVACAALDVLDPSVDEVTDLLPALSHASWEVRRRAIELATRLDPVSVRPLLSARVPLETEPAVRDALDRALSELERRTARPSRPPPSGEGH